MPKSFNKITYLNFRELLDQEQDENVHSKNLLFNTILEALVGQDKEIKSLRIEKEKTNCYYLQMV